MNIIEVKNLTKKYRDTLAVDNLTFDVKSGEILGILGPNSAGKTTVLSLVSTLLKPDRGDILFNGQSIVKKPQAIRPFLGFVPQDIALYNTLSVKDNMYFWGGIYGIKRSDTKERMLDVLETVGLKDKMNEIVGELSGGMKRRLNIAAALIHQPQIVVMDEPTVGIDTESREYIVSALKNLKNQGIIVIYTSHYIEEAEYLCDRVMVMNKGKTVVLGTIDELRNISGLNNKITIKINPVDDMAILKKIPFNKKEGIKYSKNAIEITVFDEKTEIIDVVKILAANGIDPLEACIEKPELETIYLKLLKKDA